MTQIAHALNARDYKGSPGKQMMTVAAMCLQSTKELNQRNVKSQIASKQEKTEDCQSENRKER